MKATSLRETVHQYRGEQSPDPAIVFRRRFKTVTSSALSPQEQTNRKLTIEEREEEVSDERLITGRPGAERFSVPEITLTALGVVLAVIGLFVAGNIALMSLGLGAVFAAGLLALGGRYVESKQAADGNEPERTLQ